jgi:hypothetical protein
MHLLPSDYLVAISYESTSTMLARGFDFREGIDDHSRAGEPVWPGKLRFESGFHWRSSRSIELHNAACPWSTGNSETIRWGGKRGRRLLERRPFGLL